MEDKPESKKVAKVAKETPAVASFQSSNSFELMQRMAKLLSSSDLVPKEFKNNLPNTVIALEMAHRVRASPLAVMQNLYIVHGKPSWSSQFIIAAINNTGNYSPLRFKMEGEGEGSTCFAWAIEKATGDQLDGPKVSMDMAKKEGWIDKNGSKWKTMPELMMRYRAAAFFGRLYAPEILMGMQSVEEIHDIIDIEPKTGSAADVMKQFTVEKEDTAPDETDHGEQPPRQNKPKADPEPKKEAPAKKEPAEKSADEDNYEV
jgi:hypothetical protein